MKEGKKKAISPWKIAAAYIGTVVGAGFASGQEILQFFGYFGIWGVGGIILTAFLFFYFGLIILNLGRELKAKSHLPIIKYAGGKWIGKLIDYVITFFLFGALTAMAAGAGSIFAEQFKLSPLIGNVLMILATLLTVVTGISGVISAISFVVPLLLVSVLGISIYSLMLTGFSLPGLPPGRPAVPFWPLAAFVYVSYNLVVAVAVLGPLGNEVKKKENLYKGAVFGAIGLGIGAMSILAPLLASLPEAARYDIPMIYISGQISPLIQTVYSGVLFLEIYTTAVGSLYGFIARWVSQENRRNWIIASVGTSFASLIASQVGFTNLVRILYPLVGYAGLLMLGGLLYRQWVYFNAVPEPALRPTNDNVESVNNDEIKFVQNNNQDVEEIEGPDEKTK